ncbi:vesicle-trafficking protein SEC22a isoform X2 [Urocitellus parryii]|uniref:Vesicle-trafficking protein SEC22a n=1 Tax=Urocitellus parryii TaxID=9999 RepID=A0A8D2I5R4_UROPR
MSVILSASVIRVRDGLPLSASTDYEQSTGMQECRKYFKMLSRKLAQLPDRCTLKTGHYNINFISSLGVSYMMLCTENYPNVLAFSFLDELQKEFITTYNMMKTNTAVRPYCFIEFDNFIQRTKQRYNNPRSLSTKINLSDMQMEIKLRPPYQIPMCELGSANGVTSAFSVDYKGAGKISSAHQRLEPATLSGIVAFILSLLCGALNLIRGFHAIESLLQSHHCLLGVLSPPPRNESCFPHWAQSVCVDAWAEDGGEGHGSYKPSSPASEHRQEAGAAASV